MAVRKPVGTPRLPASAERPTGALRLEPRRLGIARDSLAQATPLGSTEAAGYPEQIVAFERITIDPRQMGGVPCLRGLRIPVATVVGMIAEGLSEAQILESYPDLEREDIREALRFASEAVRERELPLRKAE